VQIDRRFRAGGDGAEHKAGGMQIVLFGAARDRDRTGQGVAVQWAATSL
jgi:hypothetical protein